MAEAHVAVRQREAAHVARGGGQVVLPGQLQEGLPEVGPPVRREEVAERHVLLERRQVHLGGRAGPEELPRVVRGRVVAVAVVEVLAVVLVVVLVVVSVSFSLLVMPAPAEALLAGPGHDDPRQPLRALGLGDDDEGLHAQAQVVALAGVSGLEASEARRSGLVWSGPGKTDGSALPVASRVCRKKTGRYSIAIINESTTTNLPHLIRLFRQVPQYPLVGGRPMMRESRGGDLVVVEPGSSWQQ